MNYILKHTANLADFKKWGGGKAANLSRMNQHGLPVPEWFCVSAEAFAEFVR